MTAPHPRLYLDPARIPRATPADPGLRRLADRVAADARTYLADTGYDEVPPTHNGHLIRARAMQGRVVTLVVQWLRTADRRYRDAAVEHLRTIGRWEYWSWIAWRRADPRPEAIFDLSYGENSATLALGYDLLHDELTDEERAAIRAVARERSFTPFRHVVEHDRPSWYGRPDSNWNTVCAGGAGLLALAMHGELCEAAEVLASADASIGPYMRALEATDGGWPEGIGYWNYGMRYAFMYLLSHERATGEPHPLLGGDGARRTVAFPLDFCPYGQPCSFGDSNHWSPLPFHYAAARRLGADREAQLVDAGVRAAGPGHGSWPDAAEALALLPADPEPAQPDDPDTDPDPGPDADAGRVRHYRGLGWVRLADRWPDPRLYLAVRGGTTEVPHGHLDLLSFYAAVGDECLVENLTPAEYLDTTFGSRRAELFEMRAQSKNVPLVDGVGIAPPAVVEPELVDVDGYPGVLLDATEAMGGARDGEALAESCRRLFVLFDDRAVLVLDAIDLWHEGRVETRLHTRARVDARARAALLRGDRQALTVRFAADAPFALATAPTVPTTPGDDATVLRWHGPVALGRRFCMAMLLVPGLLVPGLPVPGETGSELAVVRSERDVRVRVRAGTWARDLHLGADLRPA